MLGGSHFFVRTDPFQFSHDVMRTWSVLEYIIFFLGLVRKGQVIKFLFFSNSPGSQVSQFSSKSVLIYTTTSWLLNFSLIRISYNNWMTLLHEKSTPCQKSNSSMRKWVNSNRGRVAVPSEKKKKQEEPIKWYRELWEPDLSSMREPVRFSKYIYIYVYIWTSSHI